MTTAQARSGFRFFHPWRVRYNEIDGQGVVYNAHYLTFFDVAIYEYLRGLGFLQDREAKASGCDFHVVRALVDYKSPLMFDDEFAIGIRVARIGRSSITFAAGIFRDGIAAPLATGEIVWVYTDQATKTPLPVPEALRLAVAAFEAQPAPHPAP